MMKGRLGLDDARVPHKDRHGILWLSRGQLAVQHGTLHFVAAGDATLPAGRYDIPYQGLSCLVLGPGTTISHDAIRLLARHGTGLVASGTDGVRMYGSMPFGPDRSELARTQARYWADASGHRIRLILQMYEWRMGERLNVTDIRSLRGIEGARVKRSYQLLAQKHGVSWSGRRYDRNKPDHTDPVNMAVNHAAVAVYAAAQVAVACVGAIPQLGFIHEASGIAFCLDIADLYRESVTLPAAFRAVKRSKQRHEDLERCARQEAGRALREGRVVSDMIDRIKELFRAHDGSGDPRRSPALSGVSRERDAGDSTGGLHGPNDERQDPGPGLERDDRLASQAEARGNRDDVAFAAVPRWPGGADARSPTPLAG